MRVISWQLGEPGARKRILGGMWEKMAISQSPRENSESKKLTTRENE